MTKKEDTTESLTMTFEYDSGGRRTKMTDPESGDTTWEYSVADHLTKITNPEADATEFEHDVAGQRTKLRYNSGAYTNYSLDDAGHLLTLHNRTSTDASISKFEYEYDVVGNRTKMVVDGSDTTSYQYDDTYQLTKATYPGGAVHDFAYGASGNRTDWDVTPGPSYDYYYDAADQVTNMTVNGTTWSYYYDGNGAMTTATDGTVQWDYYYNYDGRLYGVNKNTSSVLTNTYNPDGTRRSLGNGGTINFLYDGQSILAEYDSNWANPDITYTHGPGIDEPLVMTLWSYTQEPASDTEYCIHRDALGSTRQLTNSDENTVTTYSYDAWGKTTESTIIGSVSCPFRYTGREWDTAAEFYHHATRAYAPELGRFLFRDPWGRGFGGGFWKFIYQNNSPLDQSPTETSLTSALSGRPESEWPGFTWETRFAASLLESWGSLDSGNQERLEEEAIGQLTVSTKRTSEDGDYWHYPSSGPAFNNCIYNCCFGPCLEELERLVDLWIAEHGSPPTGQQAWLNNCVRSCLGDAAALDIGNREDDDSWKCMKDCCNIHNPNWQAFYMNYHSPCYVEDCSDHSLFVHSCSNRPNGPCDPTWEYKWLTNGGFSGEDKCRYFPCCMYDYWTGATGYGGSLDNNNWSPACSAMTRYCWGADQHGGTGNYYMVWCHCFTKDNGDYECSAPDLWEFWRLAYTSQWLKPDWTAGGDSVIEHDIHLSICYAYEFDLADNRYGQAYTLALDPYRHCYIWTLFHAH